MLKSTSKTTENKAKEQKRELVDLLIGTLAASLLGNILSSKRIIQAGEGKIRPGQDF